MKDTMNLQEIIYSFLETQIKFGAYRFGDSLPSIDEASWWVSVSWDTVRSAYLKLKQEGIITLTKKTGATVAVQYSAQEIEQHIQTFFSLRKDAVIDLCHSLDPLFSHAQWLALKNTTPEQLDEIERLCSNQEILPTYMMLRHVHLIYTTLNNDLLLRLVWQAFLFFQGPFLSLPQNIGIFENGDKPLLSLIALCRQKDWNGLWHLIKKFQTQLSSAISQFYENSITMNPSREAIAFHWSVYAKSSQLCYSLAIELLKDIRHGVYLEKTFLPSPAKMAKAKQVSVSTIRRTLALLNQLGITRSINGVGTQVLQISDSKKNCDFSQPILQKRLLDSVQSLQILALTCKRAAEITFTAMETSAIQHWKEQLLALKETPQPEIVVFSTLEVISQFAPIQIVREIYTQLLQTFLWCYPLCSMQGSMKSINAFFYLSHIDSLVKGLEQHNGIQFAIELEALLCHEVEFVVTYLEELGISSVSSLVILKH